MGSTNYPASLDSFSDVDPDGRTDVATADGRTHDEHHNDVAAAVVAIETELGAHPKGSKASVAARLDALDATDATEALAARQIIAGAGLTGGGSLAADRTLTTDSAPASLGIADGAVHNPQYLAGWKSVLADVKAGGRARMQFIGDSITYGYQASGYAGFVELIRSSLSQALGVGSHGLDYTNGNTCAGGSKRSYVTAGSGWSLAAGYSIGGQGTYSGASGASGTLTYGPFTCTSFTVWYIKRAGTGTFTVQIDSDTPVAAGGTGADVIASVTVTAAGGAGSHTLTISGPTGGTSIIIAIEPDLNGAGLYVGNAGAASSSAVDWNADSAAWHPLKVALEDVQPDLTVIGLGINDHYAGHTAANFKTALSAIVAKAQLYGTAVLWVEPERGGSFSPVAPWADYVAKMYEVADEKQVALLDIGRFWGGKLADFPSYDSGDQIHPSTTGHQSIARAMLRMLTTANEDFRLDNRSVLTDGTTLTGGGTLAADRTLSVKDAGITPVKLGSGYVSKTSTYAVTAADSVVDCTSGTFTVTLPDAASVTGRRFTIRNPGSGTITVARTSSQAIDGRTADVSLLTKGWLEVMSTGSAWIVLSGYTGMRNMTGTSLSNGWLIYTSEFYIARSNNMVELNLYLDSTSASSNNVGSGLIPAGFRPVRGLVDIVQYNGISNNSGRAMKVDTDGTLTVFNQGTVQGIYVCKSWPTSDAWPSG